MRRAREGNGRLIHPAGIARALRDGGPLDLLRAHFGLDASARLRWGRYDGWDGLCEVVTDGTVAWHSPEMARLVRESGGEELPTFGASRTMGRSIDARLAEGAVDPLHLALARRHGLEIRGAVGEPRIAYLTKARNRASADDLSVAYAAVPRLG